MTRLLSTLVTLALLGACASDLTNDSADEAAMRDATGPLAGRAIEFALEPGALDPAAIDAIAKRVEQATAAESVGIQVRESGDEGTVVVIETWGRATVTDDELVAGLRRDVPALTRALITVRPISGDAPSGPAADLDLEHDEDPEAVRRRVIEKLRADGVAGDIEVIVEDGEDGKREIRVEVEERR